MGEPRGVLLDIDGVLTVSWEALPGAVETIAWLRRAPLPFRLITNTTTHTRRDLAATLRAAGFDVGPREIVTAVVATASYLQAHHPGAGVFVLSDGDAGEDLEGIALSDLDEADVVVLGGAGEDFTYAAMNRIFRRLTEGATLVGMHRNLYWRTSDGWRLDGGAYIAGLEEATGRAAAICGKPAAAFFEEALRLLDVPADRAVMVGDDLVNDVLGAQAAGVTGALVRTGKFLPGDLERGDGEPHHVLDSIADLPGWLGRG
ncbi:MAG TPA: TIGR01458 family HAD-type hydrolase [Actinomycetota bacterium]|nr:TIGR01458 family HAD-type hydrolase [Actinomycetota bacterium]